MSSTIAGGPNDLRDRSRNCGRIDASRHQPPSLVEVSIHDKRIWKANTAEAVRSVGAFWLVSARSPAGTQISSSARKTENSHEVSEEKSLAPADRRSISTTQPASIPQTQTSARIASCFFHHLTATAARGRSGWSLAAARTPARWAFQGRPPSPGDNKNMASVLTPPVSCLIRCPTGRRLGRQGDAPNQNTCENDPIDRHKRSLQPDFPEDC